MKYEYGRIPWGYHACIDYITFNYKDLHCQFSKKLTISNYTLITCELHI